MLKDVNADPRRWVDSSRRVRVVEGWHPSAPSRVGYNLMVDGDWHGTFASLEAAAVAAGDLDDVSGPVALRPDVPGGARGRRALHVVPQVSSD
jgi:hypothetical protein